MFPHEWNGADQHKKKLVRNSINTNCFRGRAKLQCMLEFCHRELRRMLSHGAAPAKSTGGQFLMPWAPACWKYEGPVEALLLLIRVGVGIWAQVARNTAFIAIEPFTYNPNDFTRAGCGKAFNVADPT